MSKSGDDGFLWPQPEAISSERVKCVNVIQLLEWFYLTMPHNFYAN